MSTNSEPAQGSRAAKVMAYDAIRKSHERRARNAIADLREALDKAERRMDSTDLLDRQLVGSSAADVIRSAAAFTEEASAWAALVEVSFFTAPDAKA
jgi:hypothetical protein